MPGVCYPFPGLQQFDTALTGLAWAAAACRDGQIRVKLISPRGENIVEGTFVSREAVRFKTPAHEQHGALLCNVYVSIGSDNWTVNQLKFQVGEGIHAWLQAAASVGCAGWA